MEFQVDREATTLLNRAIGEAVQQGLFSDSKELYAEAQRILARKMTGERRASNIKAEKVVAEDLTFDGNAGLYDSTVASVIARALRPELLSRHIIPMVRRNFVGVGSMITPLSSEISAGDVPNNGNLDFPDSVDFSNQTAVEVVPQSAQQKVTIPLLKQSEADLLRFLVEEITHYIGVRMDTKVLAQFEAFTPSNDDNANYDALGGSVDMSWGTIETYTAEMQDNKADPRLILTNPATGKVLRSGMDPTETIMSNISGELHQVPVYGGQLLITHPSISAKTTYLLDSRQVGYVFYGDPESFVGRVKGAMALEIIGYQPMAVEIANKLALHRLMDNTA